MTFREAKEWLIGNVPQVMDTLKIPTAGDGKEKEWVCPICKHGEGKSGNGTKDGLKFIDKKNPTKLHCFSCGFTGNVIDLFMESHKPEKLDRNDKNDFIKATRELATLEHLEIEENAPRKDFSSTGGNYTELDQKRKNARKKRGQTYYQECIVARNQSAEALEYLKRRGISLATADAGQVGYDPQWVSPTAIEKGYNPPYSERIILPSSNKFYVARAIEKPQDESQARFSKMNEGEADLFNLKALYDGNSTEPVFIVEGAIDALSVIEVGGQAVGLNSLSNIRILTEKLKANPTVKTLVLCLDNDEKGKLHTKSLKEELRRLNLSFICANIAGSCKDPNEALVTNRAEFDRQINIVRTKFSIRPNTISAYINNRMSEDLEAFKENCRVSTGFENLDRESEGLFQGLYVIGAISSLGKTTFALQLAENLAESGKDVIYFSLEQSLLEVVSKSLSKRMFKDGRKVRSIDIRCGDYPRVMPEYLADYQEAVGDRLSVIEGNFSWDINHIETYVTNYIRQTGKRPCVFIDYLQILQPEDEKQTTKEKVEGIVSRLKTFSRNLNLTIFAISSVNRANYLTPINFEALKETGGIEYTADVVWGLQLRILNTKEFKENKDDTSKHKLIDMAKLEKPRKIELVCLKNRNGTSSYSCYFDYYSAYDYFKEAKEW